MFIVTEEDAAAIRTSFEQEGELSAAIELPAGSQASPTTPGRGNTPARKQFDRIFLRRTGFVTLDC